MVVGIVVLWALVSILREYRFRKREARLREQPPARVTIEVRLPREFDDAPQRMQGFYRRVQAALPADKHALARGRGELHMVYYAEVPPYAQQPQLRFLISCDEDQVALIKRLLKQTFDSQAQVLPVETNPLDELADAVEQTRRLEDPHAA